MTSFGDFNLYDELEVAKESTPEEIKKAYKKMAMKWHPDKNNNDPSATDRFQRISHAYTILSDTKKRAHYDKYGKVDEDNFNFEEFMKNFSFNDFFTDLFDENMFGKNFVQFVGNPGGAFEGRHNLKLMYQRKRALNLPVSRKPDTSQDDKLPIFMYGIGRGIDAKSELHFWNEEPEDEEWTTDDEDLNNEDDDDEDIEEENVLDIFILDNSILKSKNKFSCRYCESIKETFTKKQLTNHFIDNHKTQFEEYFGPDYSWEEAVLEAKESNKGKKKGKKMGNFMEDMFGGGMPGGFPGMGGMPGGFPGMGGMPGGFPGMGGMPGGFPGMGGMPFDMGQMGSMFGMSAAETEQMMKDMEKMFGGMGGFPGGMGGFPGGMGGFPGGMGGMGGFPGGFPDPSQHNKKKKK